MFDLETCARPNILALQPYRCARDDYKDDGTNTLLDANENAYGPSLELDDDEQLANGSSTVLHNLKLSGLNRYPDPHQFDLKTLLCDLRNIPCIKNPLTPANVFVGVGSDEAIDALLRCFCVPSVEKILTCPPTYGMYNVSAQINDVAVVKVPLDVNNSFALDPKAVCEALKKDDKIKLVYICSPGNPTGRLIDPDAVREVLEFQDWNGVVVLDEAYIDFASEGSSLAHWVNDYPNLVVMQTLSKAFGMAGIRLGAAFTSPQIAGLLNSLKAPYNISSPTSQLAIAALSPPGLGVMAKHRSSILVQRERLIDGLPKIGGTGRFLGGFDANFVLVEILSQDKAEHGKPDNVIAKKVYERLAETKGVVVRFRGSELGCTGCLRITVGTEKETTRLLDMLTTVMGDVYSQ